MVVIQLSMDLFFIFVEDNAKFHLASSHIKETILDDQKDTTDGKN